MRVVTLPNGNLAYFRDLRDMLNLIEYNMGDEFIRYLEKELDDKKEIEKNLREELKSYEMSMEEYRDLLVQISELSTEIMEYLQGEGRINKQKLVDMIKSIKKSSENY